MSNINELNKVWLITGVTGQDGSTLCDILLAKGYTNIHGTMRRSSTFNTSNIDHIFDKLKLHYCDITDVMNVYNIINNVKPDYLINTSAMSHVKVSHELENYTFQVNTMGVLNILQSVRTLGLKCKIYQCSTSEMFGNTSNGEILLNEDSLMAPVSIYGISKKSAHDLCNMYRNAYDMYVISGILFNHEGPRRGHTFVTQKIADYVATFVKNEGTEGYEIEPLQLGNLNAKRDFGSTKIYMEIIYKMLQQEKSDNYVIATGETHSVKKFVELAFKVINVEIVWKGIGINEIGMKKGTEDKPIILVQVNQKYFRDIDIDCLIGDSSKAQEILGWTYDYQFCDLVKEMVLAAIQRNGKK